jgi:hypothetical protein
MALLVVLQLDYLEDPGVNERVILKLIIKKWDRGVEWVDLAQVRDSWLDFAGTVMNFRVS